MPRTFIALALALAAIPALAQDILRADPNRPTDLIATDLGLPEATFIACFRNVSPDPRHDPNALTQHANKAVLLPCLQAANPAITNEALDRVMDRYRPEGPMPRG